MGIVKKGGKGSGNFGHAGRPGKVGGSASMRLFSDALKNSPWGDNSFPEFSILGLREFYDKGFDLTTVYKLRDISQHDIDIGVNTTKARMMWLLERHGNDSAFNKFVDAGFTSADFGRLEGTPQFRGVLLRKRYYSDELYDYVKDIADKYGISIPNATHLLWAIDNKYLHISLDDVEEYIKAGVISVTSADSLREADFPLDAVSDALAAGIDPFDADAIMAFDPGQTTPLLKDTIPDFIYSGTATINDAESESTRAIKNLMDSTAEDLGGADGSSYVATKYIRAAVKKKIAKDISEMTSGFVSEETASNTVAAWAYTSNKTGDAQMIQEAVANMFHAKFGTELSVWQKSIASDYDKAFAQDNWKDGELDQVLLAMYGNTQRVLKAQGADKITLYRGFTAPTLWSDSLGKSVKAPDSALSSWTVNKDTAIDFSKFRTDDEEPGKKVGIVVAMDVPGERILSTALTGFGALPEYEATLIGSDGDSARVIDVYEGKK